VTTSELPDTTTDGGPYDPELKEAGQLTSPTWELELFLSGAFVFATFQLPGIIESVYRRIEPHALGTAATVLFSVALYGKAIAFTLIATFMIHLIARAHWVALLGVYSVYPKGIRWDEMKIGPIAKDLYRARIPDLSRAIAKLDNFCSIVFSAGLLVVIVFAYTTLLGGTVTGLAYLLALAFNHGQGTYYFFWPLLSVFVIIPVTAALIDKKYGDTMSHESRGYRVVRGMLRIAFTVNLMRILGPMTWTLMTNVGRRRAMGFLYVALTGLIVLATADRLAQVDSLSMNSYDYFGASRDHGVRFQYYESQRQEGESYTRIPSIQSDIIRDPYVKLFIPFTPPRHNAAVARNCPQLKPLQDRGISLGADPFLEDSLVVPVLACLTRLHAVTLDGAPQTSIEFSFYEHPKTGLKGMIAYIPVDSLTRGRHVVTVMPVPPAELPTDSTRLANASWRKPFVVPFWR
jgi:hypothetical protein